MFRIFLWAALLSGPGLSHAASGPSPRLPTADKSRFNFDYETTEHFKRVPLGTELLLNTPEDGAIWVTLDQRSTLKDGRPYFFFNRVREATAAEVAQNKRNAFASTPQWKSPGKDASAPLKQSTGPAATGPGQAGREASRPGGDGAGTGASQMPLDQPNSYSWGNAAANVGRAGFEAGLLAGFVHGVLLPPSEKRALQALDEEIQQKATSLALSEGRLQFNARRFEEEMARKINDASADYKPFRAEPAQAGARSAFAESATGTKVAKVRERLAYSVPDRPANQAAKTVALASADASETAFVQGLPIEAETLATIAEGFTDIALGLNPITGFFKDGVEFITGRHSLTQRELSGFERGLSGVGFAAGLASAGLASSALHGAELVAKIVANTDVGVAALKPIQEFAVYASVMGIRTAEGWLDLARETRAGLKSATGKLESWSAKLLYHPGAWIKRFDLQRVMPSDLVNAIDFLTREKGWRPAYRPGTLVTDLITKNEEIFFRLHGPHNQEGVWLIRGEAVDRSLTPAQLKNKYSLKHTPEFVSEVRVPKGTLLRRGKINNNFDGGANAIQYEIRTPSGPMVWGEPQPVEEFLRKANLEDLP